MTVRVSEFRDQINFLFDQINCHWHSCVGESEKVRCMISAMLRASKVAALVCQRAKPEDIENQERALDQFGDFVSKHYDVWCLARLEMGNISAGVYRSLTGKLPAKPTLKCVA